MPSVRARQPTIADVAQEAGVSLPTVSRVLTGSTPVRPETRERVELAMKRLHYRPNGAARALVKGSQPIIGVIAPDTAAYARAIMIASIEERARASGHLVTVTIHNPLDSSGVSAAVEVLLAQPIVGVVVLDYNSYDTVQLRSQLGGIPIATVTNGVDSDADVAHAVIDDRAAARAVVRHLLRGGTRTVHYISVPYWGERTHPRELGWRDAVSEAGIEAPPPVTASDWSLESALRAGAELAANPQVTAVFCPNDEIAFGVMRSMHDAGRRVPDDVSVAGIDDHPLSRTYVPSLTTFRLDWRWAGRVAFELLMSSTDALQRSGKPDNGLIVRESSLAT
ncbi:LacI family DNA-binding transcriptional regulator [Microbacterium sp. PRC9]|uniref:LacI family DNA-binding transcriptional regulator n=1 Tax=Microbacterium sp. PRC9 TaxID=2962591 RepID=UPI0028829172|nr:LacI family DNA-binding transcriptional regulator [Microbacterium sp. PRC9]MDT0144834.1 LacI family DNA-binding transcriptional regulator [Microbacterium sp. PRC9]